MSWWEAIENDTFELLVDKPASTILRKALFLGGLSEKPPGQAVRSATIEASTEPKNLRRTRIELTFFIATFGVMGDVARADGLYPPKIHLSDRVLEMFEFDADQREVALAIFNVGKKANFPCLEVLSQLHYQYKCPPNLRRLFFEIQDQAALIDGDIGIWKHTQLRNVASYLYVPFPAVKKLERRRHIEDQPMLTPALVDAYAILDISPDTPDVEAYRTYRRMIDRHRPDKLRAKGLPKEMMRAATERTRQIRAAWEQVTGVRGAP